MAYNPFDFFRKNQKILFAALTVMVMVMFILSFGQGDFFSQFPQWIGKWQKTGDVVAKVDGNEVKESELQDVSVKRRTASAFLLQAEKEAMQALDKKAFASMKGPVSDGFKATFGQVPNNLPDLSTYITNLARLEESKTAKTEDQEAARDLRRLAELVRASALRKDPSERSENALFFNTQPDRTPRDQLEYMLWLKKADQMGVKYTNTDVLKLVDVELGEVLGQDLGRLARSQSGKRESEVLEAVADEFRVRAAQEAVMGVGAVRDPSQMTAATTQARLEHFLNQTKVTKFTTVAVPVDAYLPLVKGEPTKAELDKIFAAAAGIDADPSNPNPGIRDPRKVQARYLELTGKEAYYDKLAAARVPYPAAAVGVLGGLAAPPLKQSVPLYTFEDYQDEQRRASEYRLTGAAKPGRQSLKINAEYDVDAFVSVFGGIAEPASRDRLASDPKNLSAPGVGDPQRQDKLLDAEVLRPEILASLQGLTLGSAGTMASPFSPAVMVLESGYRQARKRGVIGGIQAFRLAPMPGLGALGEAVGVAAAVHGENGMFLDEKAALTGFEPKHPDPANPNDWTRHPGPAKPLTAGVRPVKDFIDQRSSEQLRGLIATEDVQAFAKEMARLGGEIEKAAKEQPKGTGDERKKNEAELKAKVDAARKAADDYAAKFAADRGLTIGGTTEPRNFLTLADDTGLAPLLKREAKMWDTGKPASERARVALAQPFLLESTGRGEAGREDRALYAVRMYAPPTNRPEQSIYAPSATEPLAVNTSFTDTLTLIWRTTDEDAVRPFASEPKAIEACKAIWKRNKARELARKAVEAAAADIQQAGKDEVATDKAVAEAVGRLRNALPDTAAKLRIERLTDRGTGLTGSGYFDVAKLPLVTLSGDKNETPVIANFDPHHPAIVYESEKMREELLANQEKPVGTSFVFTDRPEGTLYLTTVAGHQTQDARDFARFVLYPESADQKQPGFMGVESGPQTAFQAWQQRAKLFSGIARQASPQELQRLIGPPPISAEVLEPRFAATARTAARTQAVGLLKAEFNYTETDAGKKRLAEKGE